MPTFVLVLLLVTLIGTITPPSLNQSQQSESPIDSKEKRICVLGNVKNPAMLPFRRGITVTQAIKQAGGISSNHKTREVRVYSQTTEGINRVIYVDLEVIKRKPYMDLELQSFDIVEVLYTTPAKKTGAVVYNPCFSFPFKRID